MILRRSVAYLSSSERRVLRSERLQAGQWQCMRCFHASRQQSATDGSPAIEDSDNPQTQNAPIQPKPRESRQQRAAKISNEVSMLQRGPPPGDPTTGPGSVTGTYQADARPPTASAGFIETPQRSVGERMGDNVSAGREGPNPQGLGRLTGTDERVRNEQSQPRATRTPRQVEEPADGGLSVLEATTPAIASQKDTSISKKQARKLQDIIQNTKSLGVAFEPARPERTRLLRGAKGPGVPTIGFESSLDGRLNLVNPVSGRKGVRLSEESGRKCVDALIAGRYDPQGLLKEGGKYKQATLNEIAKKTMMNGTYLRSDGARLLRKVQSLLPAAVPAKTAQAAKQA